MDFIYKIIYSSFTKKTQYTNIIKIEFQSKKYFVYLDT